MTDYDKLVKALRDCASGDGESCFKCTYHKASNMPCDNALMTDAAAAIDGLQAENADIREELFISQRKYDEFTTIASMQNAMLAKQLPKRGEWKVDMSHFSPHIVCSVCGVEIPCVAGWCIDAHMNYCPNCGAKMEVQDADM